MRKTILGIMILLTVAMLSSLVSAACTDSDRGINYDVKGQIVGPVGSGEGSGGWDYCFTPQADGSGKLGTTGTKLLEWYCTDSGGAGQSIKECACNDGACLTISNTQLKISLTSDKSSYVVGDKISFKAKIDDSAGNTRTPQASDNVVLRFVYPDGKTSSDGMKIEGMYYVLTSGEIPSDTTMGQYTAYAEATIGQPSNLISNKISFTLSSGANTCTDSDGGQKYGTKGTVTASNWGTQSDSCFGTNSMNLLEQYCDRYGKPQSNQVTCPGGCSNGACMPTTCDKIKPTNEYYFNICSTYGNVCFNKYSGEYQGCGKDGENTCTVNNANAAENVLCKVTTSSPTCTDSDGGAIYEVKGITAGYENGNLVTAADQCRSDGKTLEEWYCDGINIKFTNNECINGCKDGACQQGTCVGLGGTGPNPSLGPNDPNKNKVCCAGLVLRNPKYADTGSTGTCINVVGASQTCLACGDGRCDSNYENQCNCAEDCGNIVPSNPRFGSVWTDKKEYKVGENIIFYAKLVDTDGTPATPEEGNSVSIVIPSKGAQTGMYFNSASGYYEYTASPIPAAESGKEYSYYARDTLKNGNMINSEKSSFKIIGDEIRCTSNEQCAGKQFCKLEKCGGTGVCTSTPDICPSLYKPVCGCDGKTYGNECSMWASGVSLRSTGDCGVIPPVECKKTTDENNCIITTCSDGRTSKECPACEVYKDVNGCTITKCGDLTTIECPSKPICKTYRDENGCTVTECSDGTRSVSCYGTYAKLGEKFGLVEGQSVKIIDYGYLKMTLTNWMCTGACEVGKECKSSCAVRVSVEMPSKCASDSNTECTSTGTEVTLSEGGSAEVFGAKLRYLSKDGAKGVFVVEKSGVTEGTLDVTIDPTDLTIGYGDKATYTIIVSDKRIIPPCPTGALCSSPAPLTYEVVVQNLPFRKVYDQKVQLSAGESTKVYLTVTPYEIIAQKEEAATTSSNIAGKVVEVQGATLVKSTSEDSIQEIVPSVMPASTEIYRTYKFNVVVKQQDNPKNQDVAYAVLSIKPNVVPPVPPFPGEQVQIKLYKGWNLIRLPGKLIEFEGLTGGSGKLTGFVYLKEDQRYVTLTEAQKLLGDKFQEYLAKNAFWVYSPQNVYLDARVDMQISYNDIELKKGWNLVPITDDMIGGYLNDIQGDCKFDKLYVWKAESQAWEKITEKYSFSSSLLNKGILAKTGEDCRLGGGIISTEYVDSISPPVMPE